MLATAEATPNIAFVKYWGKRDEKLILPTNPSISATMDFQLRTRTSVLFSKTFSKDEIIVHNKRLAGAELLQATKALDHLRSLGKTRLKARVVSLNCFPTAAGLASSAAGFAALAVAGAAALGLKLSQKELSITARLGSGSASRSVVGGFAEWKAGAKKDGSDSYAVQLAPPTHWPEFRNVIAIVEAGEKKVKSRAGMAETVATSSLFTQRLRDLPKTLETIRKAVLRRDTSSLFPAMMRESDNMHAVMLDTWPPITYLDDVSKQIISAVLELNGSEPVAGYTFDAGPNAHIFTTERNVLAVKRVLLEIPGVKRMIVAGVGDGPRLLSRPADALMGEDGGVRLARYDQETDQIQISH